MFLPIGHDEATVRRLPLVTFALMAACVIAFLSTRDADRRADEEASRWFSEAVRHFKEHPYLVPDSRMREILERRVSPGGYREWLERARSESRAPGGDLLRLQQRELDRLLERTWMVIDESPTGLAMFVPADPAPHTLVTSVFMHVGWMHLIGNLFILYLVGPFVEDVWGRPLFLVFYLASGAIACLLFAAYHPGSQIGLVGASGAIAGTMGAFAVRYWKARIAFLVWVIIPLARLRGRAWLILGLWLAQEYLTAAINHASGTSTGVAHWAHVGGFVFGAGFALALGATGLEGRFLRPRMEWSGSSRFRHSELERAFEARDAGRPQEAAGLLCERLRTDPDDLDALAALWDVSLELGIPKRAIPHILHVLENAARHADLELVLAWWPELLEEAPEAAADPDLLLHVALLLQRNGYLDLLRETLALAAARLTPRTAPSCLFRLARLARKERNAAFGPLAESALAAPDLPLEDRSTLEGWLRGEVA